MPLGHQMYEANEGRPSMPFYSLEHQMRTSALNLKIRSTLFLQFLPCRCSRNLPSFCQVNDSSKAVLGKNSEGKRQKKKKKKESKKHCDILSILN